MPSTGVCQVFHVSWGNCTGSRIILPKLFVPAPTDHPAQARQISFTLARKTPKSASRTNFLFQHHDSIPSLPSDISVSFAAGCHAVCDISVSGPWVVRWVARQLDSAEESPTYKINTSGVQELHAFKYNNKNIDYKAIVSESFRDRYKINHCLGVFIWFRCIWDMIESCKG